MKTLIAELKRRNVFRVAGTYAVVSWIMVQIAAITTASFGAPDWVMKMLIVTCALGFPIAMVLAWAFEMTPEGVKPTESVTAEESIAALTARKLDWAILLGLICVGALIIFMQFIPSRDHSLTISPSPVSQNQTAPLVAQGQSELPPSESFGSASVQSIAVLPFDDFSPNKDQDYFAKGISEELLNVLARINGLRVASRTSAFAFKDKDNSIGEIGQALGVAHVLEGSIRKAGDTLRITAQLINTSNDEHIWSETYDRPLSAENIFEVQDEIASAIVNELKGRLSFTPAGSAGRTVSLEAYEIYLKALEKAKIRLPAPLNEAVSLFEEVIALDPNYSQAYSGLADSYMLSYAYGGQEREIVRLRARNNIDRALELSPNSAEALTSNAMYYHMFTEGTDASTSIEFAKQAIAANPNYSVAYHRLGQAYAKQFDYEESLAAFQKARDLDPLSPAILNNVARMQDFLGDWKAAKATTLDNLRWNSNQPSGYIALSIFNFDEGNYAQAHSLAKDAQALNPADTTHSLILQLIYLDAEMFDAALTLDVFEGLYPGRNAYARAIKAVEQNNMAEISTQINLIDDQNPETLGDSELLGYIHYLIGSYTKALPYFEKVSLGYGYIDQPASVENLDFMAQAYAVFDQENHPNAQFYKEKIDVYFANKSPSDFERRVELQAGAIHAAVKGDDEQALDWLDRMVELGHVNMLLKEPSFDRFRANPKFQNLENRMSINREALRQELERQRANPKETWRPF